MRFILPLIFLIFFLAGCSKEQEVKQNTLRIAHSRLDPKDWTLARGLQGIDESLAEPLIRYHHAEGKVKLEPALLTHWVSDKDFTTWTFTIRQNLKWSDGKAFKNKEILETFRRVLEPKTGARSPHVLTQVEGALEFLKGETQDFSKVRIKMLGNDKLKFELKRPNGYFPH